MRVLFLMLAYPDMEKSFNMFTTIVEEFVQHGHDVCVVAPGVTPENPTAIVVEKGIPVLRVKTLPVKNIPNLLKGFANLLLPYQYGKALRKFYPGQKFDVIIAPTPPITLVDLIARIKQKQRAKFYLILRDIFPQNAVDLGFMRKGGVLHRYFRWKEKRLYQLADRIGCMSPGNIAYIKMHNPDLSAKKIHVLENFQKLFPVDTTPDVSIRDEFGLREKFVVVFGGNMGKPQQIENVLALARSCEMYPEVIFLLLGDGLQRKAIEALIAQNRHVNVRVISTIPKAKYQSLIRTCEIGLISLHANFTIPNIPSKTLDYFNVGIPVLASIDKATDFGEMLTSIDAGLWSYAGDGDGLKKNFDRLYADKNLRESMGKKGRAYFEKNLIPDVAYQTVIRELESIDD